VFERVYEIAPCYRAEKSHTKRHLCEILTLDVEMAFGNMNDVLETFENALFHVIKKLEKDCAKDFKTLNQKLIIPELPLKRYTYTEILDILDKKCKMKIPWGEDISTEAYRLLDETIKGYYYITHWPSEQKPFYIMPSAKDPKVSESFDLQVGWLELASGGTRVHNKDLLTSRLNPLSFESHLKAFDFGMPPHAGLGFGLARFLTILTGASDIRESVMYPRTPDRLTP
jgi:nondiscriminating aspartyl-tRNA synthetase